MAAEKIPDPEDDNESRRCGFALHSCSIRHKQDDNESRLRAVLGVGNFPPR